MFTQRNGVSRLSFTRKKKTPLGFKEIPSDYSVISVTILVLILRCLLSFFVHCRDLCL